MATSATKSREIAISHSPEAWPASHYDAIVEYMRRAILDIGGVDRGTRLLDFGGHGLHLAAYLRAGFDAYGCDQDPYWNDDLGGRMKPIATPYRIPYPDDFFDAVVSTSVLEHAQNTSEVLRESKRVLKPGGVGLHLFPTKWYLPAEPHIFVPLANFFWPKVPRWWLAFWAVLGIRNGHQDGMSWRQAVEWNDHYCRKGILDLCRIRNFLSRDLRKLQLADEAHDQLRTRRLCRFGKETSVARPLGLHRAPHTHSITAT